MAIAPRLYLITDRKVTGGRALVDVVARILTSIPAGSAMLQVRERDLSTRALLALVRQVLPIAQERDCPVLVNDRLDIALAAGARGVHLPERGLSIASARAVAGPDPWIGASTHSAAAAGAAARAGADVVVCSPIWPTPSKRRYGPSLGVGAVAAAAAACAGTRAALYALGGITDPSRARAAIASGAHGVAGIRAFFAADDPGRAAADMLSAIEAGNSRE